MFWRIVIFLLACLPLASRAQYNIDKLLLNGQVALHYEDYVLSMQYFNQVIALKPYLYEPWHYRAVAKFYLDDYTGAEADISKAIELNPYISQFFDLRAIARIRQERYEGAINDYNRAIALSPMEQNYWFNRAFCLMNQEKYDAALLQTDTIIHKWSKTAKAYSLRLKSCFTRRILSMQPNRLTRVLKSILMMPIAGPPVLTSVWLVVSGRMLTRNCQRLSIFGQMHITTISTGHWLG
ncbi:MAG: tetratricopeptide repeat protein [Prevotella sp.]